MTRSMRGRSQLDTRLLEMFVLLAAHRHYGRAARASGTAQPTLSQHIAQLERLTGNQLFERTTRSVELTNPGSMLLPGARNLLGEIAALGNTAKRFERQRAEIVRVAVPQYFGRSAALEVVARLSASPHVRQSVDCVFVCGADLVTSVVEGEVDLALAWVGPGGDAEVQVSAPVALEARGVLLARTHPLAGRSTLTSRDLQTVPGLCLDLATFGPEHLLWTPNPHARPSVPPIREIEEIYDALVLHRGVILAPMSDVGRFCGDELTHVPVMDLDPVALSFAWRKHEPAPICERAMTAAGVWRSPHPARVTGLPSSTSARLRREPEEVAS